MNKLSLFIAGIAVIVILVVAVVWYFIFANSPKPEAKIPSWPAKLSFFDMPAEPIDQALAEITILAQAENGWEIRIDNIRDYSRYPDAPNPQLQSENTVSIYFGGWLDTFQANEEKICQAGYTLQPNTGRAESLNQQSGTQLLPNIIVGGKYLAKLSGCFAEIGGFTCGHSGWSGSFYNPYPVRVDFECVKDGSIIPSPPVEVQK